MRATRPVLGLLLAVFASGAHGQGAAQTCAVHAPGAASMPRDACLACHRAGGGAAEVRFTHPVDVDYGAVRARRGAEFRPSEEVARRGIALPGGQVRCATCHDGRSRWAHYLVLPAGAKAVPPVDPARVSGEATPEAGAARSAGEVSPTPLCLACHVYD